jgi:hypothetical protein
VSKVLDKKFFSIASVMLAQRTGRYTVNKTDCRIPAARPRSDASHWLVEVLATGEAVVVIGKTYIELCRLMNAEHGSRGWELHDREETGELALVILSA